VARSQLQPVAGATIIVPELLTVKLERLPGEGYAALGVESGDLYVWAVTPGTPAAAAGLMRGDRLVKMNEHVLSSWMSVELELTALEKKPFKLTWRADGVEKTQELAQAKITVEDDFKNRIEQLELGILERPAFRGGRDPLAGGPAEEMVTLTMGPKDALIMSVKNLPKIIRKIGLIFYRLFTGHVPLESAAPASLARSAGPSPTRAVAVAVHTRPLAAAGHRRQRTALPFALPATHARPAGSAPTLPSAPRRVHRRLAHASPSRFNLPHLSC